MNPPSVSPSLSCYASPLLLSKRLLKVCSLPSPKPRSRRPNYLRRKALVPKPPPLESPPPPPSPKLPIDNLRFVVLEEEEEEEEVIKVERVVEDGDAAELFEEVEVAMVGTDPFHSPTDLPWIHSDVFGLMLRFIALIAVQTIVAVFILGDKEERMEERKVGRALLDEWDIEEKVLEIRAMAKEARETERRERGEDSVVQGKVEKRLSRFRNNAKKVVLGENVFSVSLLSKNAADNMEGEKRNSEPNMGKSKKVVLGENVFSVSLPSKNAADNMEGEKRNSEPNMGKRKLGLIDSIKRTGNIPKGFNGSMRKGERGKDGSGGVEKISQEASRHHDQVDLKGYSSGMTQDFSDINDFEASSSQWEVGRVFLKNPSWKSSVEAFLKSSTNSQKTNQKDERRSFINKDEENNSVAINKPWWLKLPYVIAILLQRHSGGGHKGLYSLEINSSTGKDNASYTIAFQDRQDATNFCYLLESFFDQLGDVTADIVPLTIKEFEQFVGSDTSKVIVVRKDRIRLYAGKPLVEAEAEIRSLLD